MDPMLLVGLGAVVLLALYFGWKYMSAQTEVREEKRRSDERRRRVLSYLEQGDAPVPVARTAVTRNGDAAISLGADGATLVTVAIQWTVRENGPDQPSFETRVLPASRLLGARVIEHTWVQTNKTGGKPEKRVASVELKLDLDDIDNPCVMLEFLGEDAAWGSELWRAARGQAYHWEGVARCVARAGHGDRAQVSVPGSTRHAAPRPVQSAAAQPAAQAQPAVRPASERAAPRPVVPRATQPEGRAADPGDFETEADRRRKAREEAERLMREKGIDLRR